MGNVQNNSKLSNPQFAHFSIFIEENNYLYSDHIVMCNPDKICLSFNRTKLRIANILTLIMDVTL